MHQWRFVEFLSFFIISFLVPFVFKFILRFMASLAFVSAIALALWLRLREVYLS